MEGKKAYSLLEEAAWYHRGLPPVQSLTAKAAPLFTPILPHAVPHLDQAGSGHQNVGDGGERAKVSVDSLVRHLLQR